MRNFQDTFEIRKRSVFFFAWLYLLIFSFLKTILIRVTIITLNSGSPVSKTKQIPKLQDQLDALWFTWDFVDYWLLCETLFSDPVFMHWEIIE